ncbi:MAG: ABC transporter ATP-binding protein [Bacilli bacterium]|nr:ABC transporter ATP-binding protein [Bacilli bacterium]
MKLISISNLTKNYHTKTKEIEAIDNISFDINDNEIVSIIGPSGCGKSTILNILTNIDKPSSGSIEKKDNLKIGYMMQNDCLLPWLTVFENATLGLKLKSIKNKENIDYVNSLLEKYGLKEFANEYPRNLSGGMRQRLALIRTLAIKPDILFLDEPFSKLDYTTRLSISDDVFKIIRELNISAILITHDIKEALMLSDRIIVLSKRPAIIKDIITLEYNDTLPSEKERTNNYEEITNSIWELINK